MTSKTQKKQARKSKTGKSNTSHNYQEVIRLKSLVNAFTTLNTSLDLDQVLKNTLKTATGLLHAEAGSIALINSDKTHLEFVESTDKKFDKLKNFIVPLGEGIAGDVAQSGKSVHLDDVNKDERFCKKIDEKLEQKTQGYICVPLLTENEIIGTAQILNRKDGKAFTDDDQELLEGFAQQAALAIHNAKMHKIKMKQQAIESELEVCSQIQKNIFPEKAPSISQYEIFGSSVPCREVGGDYYTFISRADGSYDVVIADVSGKGLSAALMVSELHTGFHLLSQMDYSLDRAVKLLNDHLCETLIIGKFITLFAARIYPDSNKLEYVLAGHPSPYIVNKNGAKRQLERTGIVLGVSSDTEFSMGTFEMDSCDLLIAFTDRYSEARDASGKLFSEEPIADLACKYADLSLVEIQKKLDNAINNFTSNAESSDDATLLMIRKF